MSCEIAPPTTNQQRFDPEFHYILFYIVVLTLPNYKYQPVQAPAATRFIIPCIVYYKTSPIPQAIGIEARLSSQRQRRTFYHYPHYFSESICLRKREREGLY